MRDRDALLDADRDFAVQDDETGVSVTGARLVAQDVRESLLIPRGSLPWDRGDGSDVLLWLNLEGTPPGAIIAEIERVALADPRIEAASVVAEQLVDGRYRLAFSVIGERGGRQEVVVG
ncbi:MAG: hypothetical protein OXC31_26545 [Spirochaetaceae bacterium]|nr:hypothetical protein [Spirochaetaceae bacterium]